MQQRTAQRREFELRRVAIGTGAQLGAIAAQRADACQPRGEVDGVDVEPTVQAGAPSRLWSLTPLRFRELSIRFPPIALELSVAMAAVLARRMYNRPKRVAVT